MLSFNKVYIKEKNLTAGKWELSVGPTVLQLGGGIWTATVRWMSVGLLKGKAFFIKGTLSFGDVSIKTSWLHPESSPLASPGMEEEGALNGGDPHSIDWNLIFSWSLVCWHQTPPFPLFSPRRGENLWSDASCKSSLLTVVTLLQNSFSEMHP